MHFSITDAEGDKRLKQWRLRCKGALVDRYQRPWLALEISWSVTGPLRWQLYTDRESSLNCEINKRSLPIGSPWQRPKRRPQWKLINSKPLCHWGLLLFLILCVNIHYSHLECIQCTEAITARMSGVFSGCNVNYCKTKRYGGKWRWRSSRSGIAVCHRERERQRERERESAKKNTRRLTLSPVNRS